VGACSLWPRLTIEQPGNPVDGLSSIGIERSMITFTRKGRLRQVSSLTTSVPAVLDGLSGVDPPPPPPPPPRGGRGATSLPPCVLVFHHHRPRRARQPTRNAPWRSFLLISSPSALMSLAHQPRSLPNQTLTVALPPPSAARTQRCCSRGLRCRATPTRPRPGPRRRGRGTRDHTGGRLRPGRWP